MIKTIRAKLHGIKITDANINYQGSITLDPLHCKKVGILPLEFVEIWNKTNGARISTYVILGEEGSNCCILNGAAARTCQVGDEVIIAACEYVTREELYKEEPKILMFNADNSVKSLSTYSVKPKNDYFDFKIVEQQVTGKK